MIRTGDTVTVHYVARSLEGCVIESTHERDPLVFVAGGPEVIRGLSEGVLGMGRGETCTLSIPPEQAFGRQRTELVQTVPRECLPDGAGAGDPLTAVLGDLTFEVWVRRLLPQGALLDANHPLAGETLLIDVQVVDYAR